MKRLDLIFISLAATITWVIIASAARGDFWLASICAAGLALIVLMALPDEPDEPVVPEAPAQPYLDRFEVLRREAERGGL